MQNEVVFGWSEPSSEEIELTIRVGGNNGFSVGVCVDKNGSSWYIVSANGVTPQKWGEIPNDCIEKLSRLLTQRAPDSLKAGDSSLPDTVKVESDLPAFSG